MFFKKNQEATLNAIGLHSDGVSYVTVSRSKRQKPEITHWGFETCKKSELQKTLQTLASRLHWNKLINASYLTNEDYQLKTVLAPLVPQEELAAALQWEIREITDIPLEQAVLDTFPVPGQSGSQARVNLVIAKKQRIEAINTLFQQCKIKLSIIEIEELALRNIVSTVDETSEGSLAIRLDEHQTLIIFCKNEELYFSRRLPFGQTMLRLQPEKMEMLALEIQRSIDSINSNQGNVMVTHGIVMPFKGDRGKLVEYFNKQLSLQCSAVNFQNAVNWKNPMNAIQQAKMLLTLGTALRRQEIRS